MISRLHRPFQQLGPEWHRVRGGVLAAPMGPELSSEDRGTAREVQNAGRVLLFDGLNEIWPKSCGRKLFSKNVRTRKSSQAFALFVQSVQLVQLGI